METKDLFPFVLMLVMVGLLIGIGVITLDRFRTASTDNTAFNESITLVAGTDVTLTSTFVSLVEYIESNDTAGRQEITTANFTTTCPTTTDNTPEEYCSINLTGTGGVVAADWLTPRVTGTKRDMTKTAPTILASTRDEVGKIASDWLSLIITIAVLSIILFMVIRSFGQRR